MLRRLGDFSVAWRTGLKDRGPTVEKRKVVALGLAGVYVAASVWALWSRLDAVLLFALVSPVGASFMFTDEANLLSRVLVGAFIDTALAALAFVPLLGDLIDLGAAVAALVIVIVRFRRLAGALPGGLVCLGLYAFLWFEASLLPHQLSVAGVSRALWFSLLMALASAVAGSALLLGLIALLGLAYDRDRKKAIFYAVGFPWYLITFLLTIFLPNHQAKDAPQTSARLR